jgi:hypothetical protein
MRFKKILRLPTSTNHSLTHDPSWKRPAQFCSRYRSVTFRLPCHGTAKCSPRLLLPASPADLEYPRRLGTQFLWKVGKLDRYSHPAGLELQWYGRPEETYPQAPYAKTRGTRTVQPKPAPWRFFHGGNTGSNPVGDAKPFQLFTVSLLLYISTKKYIGTKKAQFSASTRMHFIEAPVFSH